MTSIAHFVEDPYIKKTLRASDGLGTEATRAGILDLLFKRGFLLRQAKQIHASDSAKALVAALPELCVWPDMTAHWEQQLNAISQRQHSYQAFMQQMQGQLNQLVEQSAALNAQAFVGLAKPAKAGRQNFVRRGKTGGKRTTTAKRTNKKRATAAR